MSTGPRKTAADMIRDGDNPLTRHMREIITAQGRTAEEVVTALIHRFVYNTPAYPGGMPYEPTHISFYELTFKDQTHYRQYWHGQRQEPLTLEQAEQAIDLDRLSPAERAIFESEESPL